MGILTRDAIILAAEQNVQRGAELDTLAGIRLDLILNQIYENYTFDFLSKEPPATITLTAGSKTWTVPTDYLKFQTMVLVRTDINATRPPNIQLPKKDFTDYQLIAVPDTPGSPQIVSINRVFTLDGQVPVGYVYPVPDRTYTARLSYYYAPTFSIGGSAIPVFPDQKTIVDLLTNELYQYLEDKRYQANLLEFVMTRYRRNQADDGIYPKIARLDKRKFKPQANRFGQFTGFSDTGS